MDQELVAEILTGDSDEIAELKANMAKLDGFVDLARQLDAIQGISKRFYEEARSLYQATSTGKEIAELETMLAKFFGPPVKPADKPLPRKLRKDSAVTYLGGIQKNQSLFLLPLKSGQFYGALWPWRRNKIKIEIHLGYCSDWMLDDDYTKLDTLVKRSLNQTVLEQMDTQVGGQIHGISLPSFLQMSEMEQSSFTLRVTTSGRVGKLHVAEGQLIAAETDEFAGRDAAYRIISWDDVAIEIEPADPSKIDEVKQPLMHVLMESLKIKDEITGTLDEPPIPPKPKPKPKPRRPKPGTAKPTKRLVQLERAPEPKMPHKGIRWLTLFAIALGIFAVAATGVVVSFHYMNTGNRSDQFEKLMAQVEKAPSPENKLTLLEDYLQKNRQSLHAAQIQSEIQRARQEIEDREFEQTTLKISTLPVDEQYELKAIRLYGDFLEKYPDSRHSKEINASIAEIKGLLDQFYYEELKQAARLDFGKRLAVYRQYLNRSPQGRFRQDVGVLIDEMGRQYLNYLKTEDDQCVQNKRWEPCLESYDEFIQAYAGNPLADEARQWKKALMEQSDLAQLQRTKEDAGNDYQKAYQAYRNYLAEHPDTTQKQAIEKELAILQQKLKTQRQWQAVRQYATNPKYGIYERIQRLDQYLRNNISGPYAGDAHELMRQLESQRQMALQQHKLEAQRQERQAQIQREKAMQAQRRQRVRQLNSQLEKQLGRSERYSVNKDGTFTDLNTGRTWTLLDSYQELGRCIDYKAALVYVQRLQNGGYTDWRLPKANELAGLYKKAPFFPGSGAQWYWSSEAYVKGYHSVADVVTAKQETVFERGHRKQNECGSVRAIRP